MCRLAGFGCGGCFRGDSSLQSSRAELQAARSSATLRCEACDMIRSMRKYAYYIRFMNLTGAGGRLHEP